MEKNTNYNKIKVIAFDADDTLWINEPYFRKVEREYCKLLSKYVSQDVLNDTLFDTEMKNLEIYGYGAKAFTLSLIENAINVTNARVKADEIEKIILLGRTLMEAPMVLIDGIKNTLSQLYNSGKYKLVVASKGDLIDQERKLKNSGLMPYFDHVEIMSGKKEADYIKLINRLGTRAEEFLMIGNSPKSDILPVLEIGAKAILIPYETVWIHEAVEGEIFHDNFQEIKEASQLLEIL
ncbi:MAG: HAD family hydrolase [Bacteroidales bacterium]